MERLRSVRKFLFEVERLVAKDSLQELAQLLAWFSLTENRRVGYPCPPPLPANYLNLVVIKDLVVASWRKILSTVECIRIDYGCARG